MKESTKNFIVVILLLIVAFMGVRYWFKKRNPARAANGTSVSDIYIEGGIPFGNSMDIPNPDSGTNQDNTEGSSNMFPLFDYVQSLTIGAL